MSRLARAAGLSVALGAATVLPGFLIGALALQMRQDLDASVGAVAAGVTVFFAAGALGAGPGGRLAERLGALRAMRGAVLITAACLFAIGGLADSLLAVFALLAVAGVANAVNQPAINLFMADAVPRDRQGLAFGIKQSAIPGAILVSGLALPLLAIPFGWRVTFAICGGLVLAVALLARRGGMVRDHAPADREPPPRVSRELLFLAVGAALAAGGANALSTYLVASAVDAGIEEGTAGLVAALGSGVSLAVRMWVGARADRRRDYGYTTIVLLLVAGAAGYLLMATGAVAAFVAGAVVAFALGWGWPGLFNLAVVENHREAPGAATGITQSGIYVGAAAGPALYGLLSHGIDYEGAWAVVAGISLAAAVVMAAAGRRDVAVAQRPANSGRASRGTRARPRRSRRWPPASPAPSTSCSSVSESAGLAAASITRFASPTATGAAASSSFAERLGGRVELVGGRDAVGEADPVRLVAVDDLAGHDQLLRAADADHGGQPRAAADVRDQPDRAPRGCPRPRPRPSRASRRPAPAPSRRRCAAPWIWHDRRLRHLLEQVPPADAAAAGTGAGCPGCSERSCRSPRSMPDENIGPSPRTTTTRTESSSAASSKAGPSACEQLAVHRVALLRPVDDDVADRPAVLDLDQWHVGSPRSTTDPEAG